MAKNLRANIPNDDTLAVYDTNHAATQQFVDELPDAKTTSIADSPRHVAEQSVRLCNSSSNLARKQPKT